jgi:uncharacterized membrane protein
MNWYEFCMMLHVLAMAIWLGHMFFWSIFCGPMVKKIPPPETGSWLREVSLSMGGLGWPALTVLVATGIVILNFHGATVEKALTGELFAGQYGHMLGGKLALVAAMIGYQAVVGHRSAPLAVYFNMLAALIVVALSVALVRGL